MKKLHKRLAAGALAGLLSALCCVAPVYAHTAKEDGADDVVQSFAVAEGVTLEFYGTVENGAAEEVRHMGASAYIEGGSLYYVGGETGGFSLWQRSLATGQDAVLMQGSEEFSVECFLVLNARELLVVGVEMEYPPHAWYHVKTKGTPYDVYHYDMRTGARTLAQEYYGIEDASILVSGIACDTGRVLLQYEQDGEEYTLVQDFGGAQNVYDGWDTGLEKYACKDNRWVHSGKVYQRAAVDGEQQLLANLVFAEESANDGRIYVYGDLLCLFYYERPETGYAQPRVRFFSLRDMAFVGSESGDFLPESIWTPDGREGWLVEHDVVDGELYVWYGDLLEGHDAITVPLACYRYSLDGRFLARYLLEGKNGWRGITGLYDGLLYMSTSVGKSRVDTYEPWRMGGRAVPGL